MLAVALGMNQAATASTIDVNFACSGTITGSAATGLYAASPSTTTNLCTTTAIGGDSVQDKYGPGHNLPSTSPAFGNFYQWTQAVGNIAVAGGGSIGWNQNQGEANNGNTAGVLGDTSLDGGTGVGGGFAKTGSITLTDGGAWFQFNSVDLKTIVNDFSYTIQGYLGNTLEYTISCGNEVSASTACSAFNTNLNTYQTVSGNSTDVNELVITLTDNGSVDYLDNVDITGVPEPGSLFLLGTGLLGLGILVRSKFAA